jgi:hypothetical protein
MLTSKAVDQDGGEARTHNGDFSFLDGYHSRSRCRSNQRGTRCRPSRLQLDVRRRAGNRGDTVSIC